MSTLIAATGTNPQWNFNPLWRHLEPAAPHANSVAAAAAAVAAEFAAAADTAPSSPTARPSRKEAVTFGGAAEKGGGFGGGPERGGGFGGGPDRSGERGGGFGGGLERGGNTFQNAISRQKSMLMVGEAGAGGRGGGACLPEGEPACLRVYCLPA